MELNRSQKKRKLKLKREKERRKCFKSPDGGFKAFFYWLEKYCYIEAKEEGEAMLFKLWPAQAKILHRLFFELLLIMIKARQLGMTWLCAAYSLWFAMFHPMKLVVVISAKGEWATEFLERVKFIKKRLPHWMITETIKENEEQIVFKHKGGNSTIKSLATTEAGAQSKTPDLLILDETCWNPYIKQAYNASKPGIKAAGGRIIVISNSIKCAPGWGWTKGIYTNSMKGLNKFKRIFMPWWDRPGRPKDFIEREIQDGMDEDDAIEHYPSTEQEAISIVGGSYFGKTLKRHNNTILGHVGELRKKQKEYHFHQETRGILEIWRYPYFLLDGWDGLRWTNRYAIGSDVSEGLGATYSVSYVYDRLLHEFIARLRSNRVDAYQWAELLYKLSFYYENALICAERTGAGQTTVKRLKQLNANQYVKLKAGKVGSEVTKEFGWNTSDQSKHELCGDLKQWFRSTDGSVYCALLLDEASTFLKHDNGKLNPEDGKFGDCVMGAGCTLQADSFIGPAPKRIEVEPDGWLQKWQNNKL